MSWRSWVALLGVCLATIGACSGKSSEKDPVGSAGGNGGSAADGVGGTGGTLPGIAGQAGDDAGFGTTSSAGPTGLTSTGTTFGGTGSSVSGSTTATATATTGSMPGVPATWTCTPLAYDNAICDCGCGAPDPDCAGDDLDDCQVCDASGSCNGVACPGKIDPEDTAQCLVPPAGWTCLASGYDDGLECNCGCGVVDPDCEDSSVESCDVCYFSGSCAGSACPSSIDADDNSRCDVPEGWTCTASLYGNGVCHCGCGVVDKDCSSASRDACEVCWTGCSGENCPGRIDQENNAICSGVPPQWTCSDRFYMDGSLCHCGCGAMDPDCASNDIDACEHCDFEGSCSARACPGTIDPDNIAICEHPSPPAEWTCDAWRYADGMTCDCGCGAIDLDCPDDSIESCEECYVCGSASCPNKIDPNDIASCIPPPNGWTCADDLYGSGYGCDCGCGALDPDCASAEASSCQWCPVDYGSCAVDYYCEGVLPDDNARCGDSAPAEWNCDGEAYGDGACDCGCGARDADCPSANASACDFCDVEGSCSDSSCDNLDPEDNAVCVTEP